MAERNIEDRGYSMTEDNERQEYPYTDEEGNLIFTMVRTAGKKFHYEWPEPRDIYTPFVRHIPGPEFVYPRCGDDESVEAAPLGLSVSGWTGIPGKKRGVSDIDIRLTPSIPRRMLKPDDPLSDVPNSWVAPYDVIISGNELRGVLDKLFGSMKDQKTW